MMGRGSPLVFWVGASLALHLLAGIAWLAASPAPAASAQARLLALQVVSGRDRAPGPVAQKAAAPALASPRPVRQAAVQAEPAPQTTTTPTRRHAHGATTTAPAHQAAAEPPARAPQAESTATLALRLQARLLELLAEHLQYPPLAQRRGWEGVVLMQLRMEANGDISRLQVLESSGHPLLDRAATRGLQQVQRLPQAVAWLRGEPFELVLPVHYRLIDL